MLSASFAFHQIPAHGENLAGSLCLGYLLSEEASYASKSAHIM